MWRKHRIFTLLAIPDSPMTLSSRVYPGISYIMSVVPAFTGMAAVMGGLLLS